MTIVKEIKITREQNKMVRSMLDSHMAAMKNWIVSAVSAGNFKYAQEMTSELMEYRDMCSTFVPDDMFPKS